MELKEWLDLLAAPGLLIGGFIWLHKQIKAEVKTVRDEAKTAHDAIGKNIGQVREDLGEEHRAGAGRRAAGGLEGGRAGERDKGPAPSGWATGRDGWQGRPAGSLTLDSGAGGIVFPIARRGRLIG